ncbi:MAG TPA: FecR domain-containing protein, partial [Polyangiaceae bacterium]|nr:FecR domain-containing protein [Polyangiaceae bacterium]
MTPGLPPDGGSLAQALRALARETAEMPVPELDWDRIERALAVQVEGSREPAAQVPAKRPRVVGSPWVIACAAAAVVAVVYASQSGRLRAVTARSEAKLPSVAEAGSSVLTYERAGVVSFSLDPESRIEVTQGSAAGAPFPMTVVLLSGTIHAEVAPQPNGEVFAVEVGRTRIAVHGTSFSVSREGDEAIVDVSHGSVAV